LTLLATRARVWHTPAPRHSDAAAEWGEEGGATPSVFLEAERSIGAHFNEARGTVARTLRERGFKITLEHSTRLEAQRGSQIALRPGSAPFAVEVRILPTDSGCSVVTAFRDRWVSALVVGVQSTYQKLFEETQQAIDGALARLDPQAATSFAPPRITLPETRVPALERATAAVGRATDLVANRAGDVLDGGARGRSPEGWRGLQQVRFDAAAGSAQLDVPQTEGLLMVAVMVGSHPGTVPPDQARGLELFAARVEAELAAHTQGLVRITVTPTEEPLFEFMFRQSQIRAKLPLRTLHVCQDCRFEKVTNPDYERLSERARKLRVLSGGAGLSISGVNPFATMGALAQVKKLEPDFVCPQCQGLRSEAFVVTFCPQCGARTQDVVLTKCAHCGHDFADVLPSAPIWQDLPQPQLVAPPQYSPDGRWWWDGTEWRPVVPA
jgi:hypothetical protein